MSSPSFTVAEIRQVFLDFFKDKSHTVVASSSLVPNNDPTLMFTNSGMVQFKEVFLGAEQRPYVRAASVQACLRAGGKHNDLENVGYTARHHTFFEMLGNWSFGDYFKRESLLWGWELLTKVFGLPAERLMATVYIDDDEAYDIWTKEIGLPPERVVRIGDNKGKKYASDNFWMMADVGPCGPCSEIFYDHGEHIPGGPPGSPGEDGDRFIEIWNHVFMQYEMHADGSLTKLPAPCVDTGMGLERLAAILQHVNSNYDIDLFKALIGAAGRATHCSDLKSPSLKVIADHLRASSFLIADGVLPSNEGRGYVLRRIVRRAIRHGYKLGQKTPFFYTLVPDLIAQMGAAYPHVLEAQERIAQALQAEEERFFETLEKGMEILDTELSSGSGQIAGAVAFKLHDTYGFPLDLTQDVARERQVVVDVAGFEEAMQKQKSMARAAGKFKMDKSLDYQGAPTEFVGYERLQQEAQVLALYVDGQAVSALQAGDQGIVVLDKTPFYAESGGQVGDQGRMLVAAVDGSAEDKGLFVVNDTQKIKSDVFGHYGRLQSGSLALGDKVQAEVDPSLRAATVRHHSATHLMHKALRQVLGEHVQQKGSEVSAERTRFDFSHPQPLSAEEIRSIESQVNSEILANQATQARLMSLEDAKSSGAMMLFGEKYGETVRVLDIGSSTELCGGTHVSSTGDIGLFKVVSEVGVAAGVRRIEAVTGLAALDYLQSVEHSLQQAAALVKSSPTALSERLQQLQEHSKAQEKEIQTLKEKIAQGQAQNLLSQVQEVGRFQLLSAQVSGVDAKTLREMATSLREQLPQGVVVLACGEEGKVQIVAAVAPALLGGPLKAGAVVNHVATQVGGKGGGKPDFAMAGGTEWSQLPAAFASLPAWLEQYE